MAGQGLDANFIRPLFGDDDVSLKYVIELMRRLREVRGDDAHLADLIFPGCADYLGRFEHRSVIRADFSNEEIRKRIKTQKVYFNRLASLLPSLLKILGNRTRDNLVPILHTIDDFQTDYDYVLKNKRRDKIKRELLNSFESAVAATETAIAALKAIENDISVDFEHAHRDYHKILLEREAGYSFQTLIDDLGISRDVLKLVRYRTKAEDNYRFIGHNQIRTFVVEHAYRLSVFGEGPKLVTTPGSDFAALCGILNEIGGGSSDDSFAGAISRYARSKERKEFDIEEEKFVAESREDRNATNNFKGVIELIEREVVECRRLIEIVSSKEADDDLKRIAHVLLTARKREMNDALERYGPNFVWISQIPESDELLQKYGGLEELEEKKRGLDIELGQRRRASNRELT